MQKRKEKNDSVMEEERKNSIEFQDFRIKISTLARRIMDVEILRVNRVVIDSNIKA